MRARRDDADEGFHGTGQRPLRVQLRGEVVQLLARGQLAEQQEIGNLLERGVLRQIADRVAAVPETGRSLVHFAEGALARDHALKTRTVGWPPTFVLPHYAGGGLSWFPPPLRRRALPVIPPPLRGRVRVGG